MFFSAKLLQQSFASEGLKLSLLSLSNQADHASVGWRFAAKGLGKIDHGTIEFTNFSGALLLQVFPHGRPGLVVNLKHACSQSFEDEIGQAQ
jgi:hypothetical protein